MDQNSGSGPNSTYPQRQRNEAFFVICPVDIVRGRRVCICVVQAVVESCGLTRPDVGEQYWRLPAEISVAALQVTETTETRETRETLLLARKLCEA